MKFFNVFSGNLSGKFKEYFVKNMGDMVFNSLHSYWYFKGLDDETIKDAFSMTKGSIIIDSGAFTAWSKDITIDVDKYIEWINKWDNYVTAFGQLDVIPLVGASKSDVDECCKKTWDNYLYMTSKMNSPKKLLYTFHVGEDYKWLEQALEYRDEQGKPIEYMALGGLVGKTTQVRKLFLDRCFEIIAKSSNPNIKVHGFGVSSERLWRDYKFESCDSFTPGKNANHGYLCSEHGSYRPDDYRKIFKPRANSKKEEEELAAIEAAKSEEQKQQENDIRTDEKTKILLANIKYWTDLGNSIEPPKISYRRGLF